jgi:AraC-like DNA-binding protein
MKDEEPVSRAEISAAMVSQMLRYASSRGIDTGALLSSLGVEPSFLDSPDARLPAETYLALQEEAAALSGDEYFGLHMGEFTETGSYSILGYLMMNCRNLAEASEKSMRYARIIGTMIQVRMQIGFGKVKLILGTPRGLPPMSRHCYESTLAGSVRMMRSLAGAQVDPLEVGFSHAPPPSSAEHLRVFRCPVLFGQRQTYMVLPMSVGGLPVLAPDARLLEYFEDYARRILEDIDEKDRYTRLATKAILQRLDDGSLSVGSVAKDLAMSPRTLQSRLKDEGRAFSALLDDTRQELAKRYLRERRSVEDITYLLGFSEPSAFRKAFKKWSGLTPREYREGRAEAV